MCLYHARRMYYVQFPHSVVFDTSQVNVFVGPLDNGHVRADDTSVGTSINQTSSLGELGTHVHVALYLVGMSSRPLASLALVFPSSAFVCGR